MIEFDSPEFENKNYWEKERKTIKEEGREVEVILREYGEEFEVRGPRKTHALR
jgi:hypothetical protein